MLLILDEHKTHTKSLPTIDYARKNDIVIIFLPPHTSQEFHPLDRSFFKPLKTAFNSACSSWLRNHPGRRITVDQLGELFNAAYLKAATVENAISGFKCNPLKAKTATSKATISLHQFNRIVLRTAVFSMLIKI